MAKGSHRGRKYSRQRSSPLPCLAFYPVSPYFSYHLPSSATLFAAYFACSSCAFLPYPRFLVLLELPLVDPIPPSKCLPPRHEPPSPFVPAHAAQPLICALLPRVQDVPVPLSLPPRVAFEQPPVPPSSVRAASRTTSFAAPRDRGRGTTRPRLACP